MKIPGASFHAKCFNCKVGYQDSEKLRSEQGWNIMRDMCQVCHVALSGDVMTDDDRELYCNKCYDK